MQQRRFIEEVEGRGEGGKKDGWKAAIMESCRFWPDTTPASSRCFAIEIYGGRRLRCFSRSSNYSYHLPSLHSVVVISFSPSEGTRTRWIAERRGVRRGSDERSEFYADVNVLRWAWNVEFRVDSEKYLRWDEYWMKIVLRAFGHWHAPKLKVCQKVGMSAEPSKSYAFYISKSLILRPAGQSSKKICRSRRKSILR